MTHSTPRTMPRSKAWSHQTELSARKGAQITLAFMNGSSGTFTLVDSDQFTLKVRNKHSDTRKSIMTYYKHALAGFEFPEAAK